MENIPLSLDLSSYTHTHKDTNNYVSFFSLLQQMNPNLKSIQAIGSDDDEGLQNTIEICFHDSIKLLCIGHKRENIERHLKSLKAATSSINQIIADILEENSNQRRGLSTLCRQISLTIN